MTDLTTAPLPRAAEFGRTADLPRIRTGTHPGLPATARTTPHRLTPGLVTVLQAHRGYPSVSLLLPTLPGPRLAPADETTLALLHQQALRRLRTDPVASPPALLDALDRLVDEAADLPTERGLALFAGAGTSRIVTLPVDVDARVVVDPTFATRDLVRALHRTPRHVVLVLSGHRAQLFDAVQGTLAPARGAAFPIDLRELGAGESPAAMRVVDRALGAYLRLHPAPLVIAGPQRQVAALKQAGRHLRRLAGCVYGAVDRLPLAELAARTRPVLEQYLHSREQEALDLLDRRTGQHRTASGVAAAWLAARTERPEMLAVEEGFRFPARLSQDGDLAVAADDVEAPDVIDDLVDELIETVLARGGWVALVRDGLLAGQERVALTLRG